MSGRHVAVLLAAGVSRRFGADKRLALMPDGITLLQRTVSTYAAALNDVVVVLRHDDDPLELIGGQAGVRVVRVPDRANGMGDSLAAGVAALPRVDGVLVGLADKPLVTELSIKRVSEALQHHQIVVPVCRSQFGHPVGFNRIWIPALLRLRGEHGARDLLRNNPSCCHTLELADPGVVTDIDTPDQLRLLLNQ